MDVNAASRILEERWASVLHCCHFNELSPDTQEFWRPIWKSTTKAMLKAATRGTLILSLNQQDRQIVISALDAYARAPQYRSEIKRKRAVRLLKIVEEADEE